MRHDFNTFSLKDNNLVQLTRIYTKSGDKGKTSLGNSTRVWKDDPRIEVIGAVDEANASIGWVLEFVEGDCFSLLKRIQNDLFDLGADLCVPDAPQALRISSTQVEYLEVQIDEINKNLPPLKSFILPGGSKASASLHMARTIVRRVERNLITLSKIDSINPELIKYLNRLSDLLFVMCRQVNNNGANDILWIPGKNR